MTSKVSITCLSCRAATSTTPRATGNAQTVSPTPCSKAAENPNNNVDSSQQEGCQPKQQTTLKTANGAVNSPQQNIPATTPRPLPHKRLQHQRREFPTVTARAPNNEMGIVQSRRCNFPAIVSTAPPIIANSFPNEDVHRPQTSACLGCSTERSQH